LERFLILNREEYFENSAKNYTAEQKQFNNWLTEKLLEVAEQHNYVFDPEDFNFVSIRDRIRCYYKSFCQTARKRGLRKPGAPGKGEDDPKAMTESENEPNAMTIAENEDSTERQKTMNKAPSGVPARASVPPGEKGNVAVFQSSKAKDEEAAQQAPIPMDVVSPEIVTPEKEESVPGAGESAAGGGKPSQEASKSAEEVGVTQGIS
jgi:hypothetical protein